jgi:Arc/MetJ-type ribon-helix-helix transcriptional regulator
MGRVLPMSTIEIPLDLQQFVQAAITSGGFRSESEVVVEGLRLLQQRVAIETDRRVGEKGETAKSFIERANELDRRGRTDAALDLLYDSVDATIRQGRFADLDALLVGLCPADHSVDLLLGILTATLPARERLQSRRGFYRDVESTLASRGELDEGLLAGLED